jgi:hypothetical protein
LPQKITLLRSILRSYGGQARSSKTDFDPVYTKAASAFAPFDRPLDLLWALSPSTRLRASADKKIAEKGF